MSIEDFRAEMMTDAEIAEAQGLTEEQVKADCWRALGLRAVACKGWRWLPGMLDAMGSRIVAAGPSGMSWVCPEYYSLGEAMDVEHTGADRSLGEAVEEDFLPDFQDAATRGCLLALVREAWGEPDAWACPRTDPDDSPWEARVGDCYGAESEAEALVLALEAAP